MVTTGKIISINQQIGSFENNAYEVEIPILNAPGDTAAEIASKHILATASQPGGIYNSYAVGDVVYIDFVHNLISSPVIIGRIYQGLQDNYRSAARLDTLDVAEHARLPLNTTVGNVPMEILSKTL